MRARQERPEERQAVVGWGLTGAAMGALVALVATRFDRRRRKELADQRGHLAASLPRTLSTIRRDARNRTQGLISRASRFLDRGPVSDEVLEARTRSALGRGIHHARGIDVVVRDGVAALSGRVLAAERDDVVERVRGIRGVREVEDRLVVKQDAVGLGVGRIEPPQRPRPDVLQERWSPTTRVLGATAGSAAIGLGLARRDPLGIGLVMGGTALTLRAVTNMTFGRLAGVSGGRRAIDVHKTISVDASPSEVYALWSRFEDFPRFMSHVKEVRRFDERRSHWQVQGPAGLSVGFDAEQTVDEPDRVIAWKSLDGEPVRHAGIVRFEPEGAGTRIDIQMTYNPPAGIAGHVGAVLFGQDPERALDEDMLRLKSLLEEGKTTADGQEVTSEVVEAVS